MAEDINNNKNSEKQTTTDVKNEWMVKIQPVYSYQVNDFCF